MRLLHVAAEYRHGESKSGLSDKGDDIQNRVAGEEQTIRFVVEAHMSGRVAGRMQHGQWSDGGADSISLIEQHIHRASANRQEYLAGREHQSLPSCPAIQGLGCDIRLLHRMRADLRPKPMRQERDAAGVVAVPMGQKNGGEANASCQSLIERENELSTIPVEARV